MENTPLPEPPRMVSVCKGGKEFDVHLIANFLISQGIAARVEPGVRLGKPGLDLVPGSENQVPVPEKQAAQARRLLEKPLGRQADRRYAEVKAAWRGFRDVRAWAIIVLLMAFPFVLLAAVINLSRIGR